MSQSRLGTLPTSARPPTSCRARPSGRSGPTSATPCVSRMVSSPRSSPGTRRSPNSHAAWALIRNAGQSCSATTRILVHESVHDQLLDAVITRVSGLKLGPGLTDPDLGPLVSERQLHRVLQLIGTATAEGARIVVGGGRAEG